jgi:hypothetical protein
MRFFLLMLLLLNALHSVAQPAAQGVRYIVIRKPAPARRPAAPAVVQKDTVAPPVPAPFSQEAALPQVAVEIALIPEPATIPDLPPPPHGDPQSGLRDLFRVCTGERIVLAQAQNQPLARLGTVLVAGLLGGHLIGLHPDDFARGYGAAHLRRDMAALAAAAGESGTGQEAWSNVAVDVMGIMVFDPQTSRRRFEPRYLHLLWHHPDLAWGECVLTVIPWEAAQPWLATIPAQSPLEQQTLAEVIATHQFEGISLKITNNWMRLMGDADLWQE